jgi:hypothetical protein
MQPSRFAGNSADATKMPPDRPPPRALPALLLPGFAQGVARVAVSYPFDALRTFMQAHNAPLRAAMRHIPLRTLYRGASTAFVAVPIDRSIQFALLETHGVLAATCASAACSVVAQSLTAASVLQRVSPRRAFAYLFTHRTAFARAAALEAARAFCGTLVFLTTWQGVGRVTDTQTYATTICAGVFANLVAISVVYPLDTLRVRAVAEARSAVTVSGLYRGIPLAWARCIPSSVAGMAAYSAVKAALE